MNNQTKLKKKQLRSVTIQDKIDFQLHSQDSNIFIPAFRFYTGLLDSHHRLEKVVIPETLVVTEQGMFLVQSGKQFVESKEISFQAFESLVEERQLKLDKQMSSQVHYKKQLNHEQNDKLPLIIQRSHTETGSFKKNIMLYRMIKDKLRIRQIVNHIQQRFIIPKGNQASFIRLRHFTPNSGCASNSFAYKLTNKRPFIGAKFKDQSYFNLWFVKNKRSPQFSKSWEAFLMTGKSIQGLVQIAQHVTSYMEKLLETKIKEIVLDFVIDFFNTPYLVNIKYLEKHDLPDYPLRKIDKAAGSLYCTLCGILFAKEEACKIITYKLLWQLTEHLKKRKNELKGIVITHCSSRPCRVCDLCYQLTVAQHQLIQVQKEFALAQSIPIKDMVIRVPYLSKPEHRSALLGDQLYQWRLMIYVQEIVGLDVLLESNEQFALTYHLYNYKTTFKVQRLAYSKVYIINNLRVHYFFSQNENIQKFLTGTEIYATVAVESDNFAASRLVAQGSSKTISHFKNKQVTLNGQRHNSEILLFLQKNSYCLLRLKVGLVCDGKMKTSRMNLYRYNEIFFPDQTYFNSNQFPKEWMQMFDPDYVNLV